MILKYEAIVDNRLRPGRTTHDAYLLIFIAEQTSVGINAVILAVTLSPLRNTQHKMTSYM